MADHLFIRFATYRNLNGGRGLQIKRRLRKTRMKLTIKQFRMSQKVTRGIE
jgi:hypothetical protein